MGKLYVNFTFFFFLKIFYLFFTFYLIIFFRERKEGRKRGRETSMCGCFSHIPNWGRDPQPRHVPWLGIEPATLWFTGQHSIHWATPARALCMYYFIYSSQWSLRYSQYGPPFYGRGNRFLKTRESPKDRVRSHRAKTQTVLSPW